MIRQKKKPAENNQDFHFWTLCEYATKNYIAMSGTVSKNVLGDRLRSICNAYGIQILYAFGSRADEFHAAVFSGSIIDQTLAADIDVAIKLIPKHRLSIRQKAELAIELEDLLGVGRIDLVHMPDADPFLAANIVRGNRLYCIDDTIADEYELYILRRAGDLAPLERQRLKLIMDRQVSATEDSQ
jgi:hypothetical protein